MSCLTLPTDDTGRFSFDGSVLETWYAAMDTQGTKCPTSKLAIKGCCQPPPPSSTTLANPISGDWPRVVDTRVQTQTACWTLVVINQLRLWSATLETLPAGAVYITTRWGPHPSSMHPGHLLPQSTNFLCISMGHRGVRREFCVDSTIRIEGRFLGADNHALMGPM